MPKNKKPQTLEEIQEDIGTHPNRGKIGGEFIIDQRSKTFTCTIPWVMHYRLNCICASMGINRSEGIRHALMNFISEYTEQEQETVNQLSEKYGVSQEEVRLKLLGIQKHKAREQAAKLGETQRTVEEEQSNEEKQN